MEKSLFLPSSKFGYGKKEITLEPKETAVIMTIKDIETLIHYDETRTLELKKTTGELKDNVPMPQFIAERGCFRVVFVRPDYGQLGGMKGGMKGGTTSEKHQIGLSDYDLMLLDIMEGNPHVTISEMTNRIGLTRRNTYEHIKKLQAKGCLLREGPDRGGVWRVLKR